MSLQKLLIHYRYILIVKEYIPPANNFFVHRTTKLLLIKVVRESFLIVSNNI